ncbi:hypothetical protein KUCAC02_035793, partial [Chaenocephalus aceratus]
MTGDESLEDEFVRAKAAVESDTEFWDKMQAEWEELARRNWLEDVLCEDCAVPLQQVFLFLTGVPQRCSSQVFLTGVPQRCSSAAGVPLQQVFVFLTAVPHRCSSQVFLRGVRVPQRCSSEVFLFLTGVPHRCSSEVFVFLRGVPLQQVFLTGVPHRCSSQVFLTGVPHRCSSAAGVRVPHRCFLTGVPLQQVYLFLTAVPLQQVYLFQANNPYRETPSAFTEGQDKARGGELNAAVLLLEAAIQQDPQDSEAWQVLGMTQAENENEQAAIASLQRCLELRPNNLPALMSLA